MGVPLLGRAFTTRFLKGIRSKSINLLKELKHNVLSLTQTKIRFVFLRYAIWKSTQPRPY